MLVSATLLNEGFASCSREQAVYVHVVGSRERARSGAHQKCAAFQVRTEQPQEAIEISSR
jgi:hypothetical protein